jgi:hypothetical protein
MNQVDREARLQRAKEIGRVAYRIVRASKIEGFLDLEDGRKRHCECNRGGLIIELLGSAPHSALVTSPRCACVMPAARSS